LAINPHKILGIDASASLEEATKAYKKLAKQYHPDRPEGNEAKFKEVGEALDQIKNPPKPEPFGGAQHGYGNQQQEYNQQRNSTNFHDIFEQYQSVFEEAHFKPPPRKLQYNVTLEEAFFGFTLNGMRIPAGLNEGMRITAPHKDQYGADTIYTFMYKPHPQVEVNGHSLKMVVDVPLLQCILGGSVDVSTICKKNLKLVIPKLSSSKTKLKVGGYGMNTKRNQVRGDLIVHVNPILPIHITPEEEELYRRLDAISS